MYNFIPLIRVESHKEIFINSKQVLYVSTAGTDDKNGEDTSWVVSGEGQDACVLGTPVDVLLILKAVYDFIRVYPIGQTDSITYVNISKITAIVDEEDHHNVYFRDAVVKNLYGKAESLYEKIKARKAKK